MASGKKKSKRRKWLLWGAGAAVAALVLFSAMRPKQEPPQIMTEKATRGDVQATVLATGEVKPVKTVTVGSQASGQIKELKVKVGDEVKKGDLLIAIDPETQQNRLKNAQAAIDGLAAESRSLGAGVEQARRELKRQSDMLKEGATSEAQLEDAKLRLKTVRAQWEQNAAQIKKATLDLSDAKVALGYTNVTAPIDGVILSVPVEEGRTVNASLNAPTLLTMADLSKMTVMAEISEADVGKVKPGMPAYFTLLGDEARRFDAAVDSIDPAPTTVSDGTQTASGPASNQAVYYYGRLTADNKERRLRANMTANITIVVGEAKNVVRIPALALKKQGAGDKNQVEVVTDPVAKTTKTVDVVTGLNTGIDVEIKSGLKAGDEVVVGRSDGKNTGGQIPGMGGGRSR